MDPAQQRYLLRYVVRQYPRWSVWIEGYVMPAMAKPTPKCVWFLYAHSPEAFERKLRDADRELTRELRKAGKHSEG
jgi:hypothetical protein